MQFYLIVVLNTGSVNIDKAFIYIMKCLFLGTGRPINILFRHSNIKLRYDDIIMLQLQNIKVIYSAILITSINTTYNSFS